MSLFSRGECNSSRRKTTPSHIKVEDTSLINLDWWSSTLLDPPLITVVASGWGSSIELCFTILTTTPGIGEDVA